MQNSYVREKIKQNYIKYSSSEKAGKKEETRNKEQMYWIEKSQHGIY